jgi:flagellar basal-body rod modification protein FlgD
MAEDNSILWSPYTNVSVVDTWEALNPTREANKELDKDAFLKLLITQMKYQDPLNPVNDKEFLGQMAQFTALEQMVNLNATYAKTQAYSMIGKNVTGVYTDPVTEENTEVSGLVEAVTTKAGETYLLVDGKEIKLSSVSLVGDDYFTSLQLDAIYSDVTNTRAQGMVGKYVQALVVDDKGNVTDYVEGVVDYVKFVDSKTILMVGNKEVFPGEVSSVSDSPLLVGRKISEDVYISGITVKDNKATVHFDNGDSAELKSIGHLMGAVSYLDRSIEHEIMSGDVIGITIKDGAPYFQVQTGENEVNELSYLTFMGL